MGLPGGTIGLIVVACLAIIAMFFARKKLYAMLFGPSMDDLPGSGQVGGYRKRRKQRK